LEYTTVHAELSKIDFERIASADGADYHLPRGSYYAVIGSREAAGRCWASLQRRLDGRISFVFSDGPPYGFGLQPVTKGLANLINPIPSNAYGTLAGLGRNTSATPMSLPSLSAIAAPKPIPHARLTSLLKGI